MKQWTYLMLLLLIVTILTSCGSEQESQPEQPILSETENEEAEEVSHSAVDGEKTTPSSLSPVTEKGIYNGQIDSHTVQIESENGVNAYQLSDKTLEQIESLEEQTSISFTYSENENNQLMLHSIEKLQISSDEPEIITETGLYIGQVDPHTIEISINGESKAFQLNEEVQYNIENVPENQKVTFHYYKNGEQLVITKIQSIP
ncbi:hypothetical protein [Bacillus taeanensis]|uniref:Uncharacterized protein n=1 Tax=Bacillus taeanensis TaxID=273032 RepID=A0A366XZC5_9BACI|nr:hypothetical protein [Bacillus taeanensis]RBW70918.1 hypothetical protein DS031_02665 [Bacillus taeanensis]